MNTLTLQPLKNNVSKLDKQEFDNWFNTNYDYYRKVLSQKYPKSRLTITNDLSDFYMYMIERPDILNRTKNIEGKLYQFIYQRYHVFFPKPSKLVNIDFHMSDVEQSQNSEAVEVVTPLDLYENQLINILKTLKPEDRELYRLHFVKGFSARKIARKLNCSHTGINQHIKRLLNQIKNQLKDDSER